MSEPFWPIDFIKLNANAGFVINGVGDIVWTHSIALPRQAEFALELKFSGSSPRVKIEIENANVRPAAEKTTDANYVKAVFNNGGDASLVSSAISDTNVHIIFIRPAPTGLMRLKLTGNASNGADTSLDRAILTYIR